MDFLPLLPVQILLSNLLTDIAMIMIATDTVDDQELRVPTKFNVRSLVMRATVLGSICSLCDVIFLLIFRHYEPSLFRTNWFIVNVLTEMLVIFSLRSRIFFAKARMPSPSLIIAAVLVSITGIVLPMTSLGKLFGFVHPRAKDAWILMLLIPGYFIGTEVVKLLYGKCLEYAKKKGANL